MLTSHHLRKPSIAALSSREIPLTTSFFLRDDVLNTLLLPMLSADEDVLYTFSLNKWLLRFFLNVLDESFIIKEGAQFRMKAQFKVQHEILAGLKYLQKVSRGPVSNKLQEMMVSSGTEHV